MVNIQENRNLRKNNILYWERTRVTTLNNSVKPKRIRSISSVKKHTIRRGVQAITICNALRPKKIFLLEGFRKFNRSFGLDILREQFFSQKQNRKNINSNPTETE